MRNNFRPRMQFLQVVLIILAVICSLTLALVFWVINLNTAVYLSERSYINGDTIRTRTSLKKIDPRTQAVVWSNTFDTELLYTCADGNNIYVGCGSEKGKICCLSSKSGKILWEVSSSISWAPYSGIQFEDGLLYYSGEYNPNKQEFPIYSLNIETLEETLLPIGHMQLSNFSVHHGLIYALSSDEIIVYNLNTGVVSHVGRFDVEYSMVYLYEDHLILATQDHVEWYDVGLFGLKRTDTVTLQDLGVDQFTICAVSASSIVFLNRAIGDSWVPADLCFASLDRKIPSVCDNVVDAPTDIVFSNKGFYASWVNRIVYYDLDGSQRIIETG